MSLVRARVVRELVLIVRSQTEVVRADPEVGVPAARARPASARTTSLRRAGRDEELHLHLLELARAEDEVARA